ncbi:Hpt domain-containing protein [Lachnotalea sp. AF33-28]|jgi:HPt (histidine-containing phosphotransfer) domain-containing protein|uniref:Hpt domain-containing protein n=1 Tax=Lachnotalea sp. AF33-28 TaxID=2292046 RepID=UPI000E4DBC89|nr:Hpt domain-containing protein [Lachnotalea sp. AF33-28]RHP30048.1 Hpt domain-containing protein [Lachnotalea sp. AF33-28]
MDMETVLRNIDFDEAAVLNRFSGNRGLMERFIRKFPQDKTFEQLRSAVEEKNSEMMLVESHTLKGISANLGFNALYEACSRMVSHLRGEEVEAALNDYEDLEREYQKITEWLSKLDA